MTIEHGLFWIALLVFGWYLVRMVRQTKQQERAWAAIRYCHDLRSRDVWYAGWALDDAYNACYDAGMIEKYQDLREWFYGRAESPFKERRK